MNNREKVIKALACCVFPASKGFPYQSHIVDGRCEVDECPYRGDCDQMLLDAMELLKKQEPILLENQHKPFGYNTNANAPWISRCPKCKKKIEGRQTHYCKYCGQAVKWDE